MQQKNFLRIVGVIFALVFLLHLLRIIFSWEVFIGPLLLRVPIWVSWIGLIISGYLSYFAFRLAR